MLWAMPSKMTLFGKHISHKNFHMEINGRKEKSSQTLK